MKCQRKAWVTGSILTLAFGVLLWLPGLFPWSGINCWHEEIDIRSARIRYTRCFLFCNVSERVESTPVSEALQHDETRKPLPEWHLVNTFSPGRDHSPHYAFHSAIVQAQLRSSIWDRMEFTTEARRISAVELLSAWQGAASDAKARAYLDELSEVVRRSLDEGDRTPVKVADFPRIER